MSATGCGVCAADGGECLCGIAGLPERAAHPNTGRSPKKVAYDQGTAMFKNEVLGLQYLFLRDTPVKPSYARYVGASDHVPPPAPPLPPIPQPTEVRKLATTCEEESGGDPDDYRWKAAEALSILSAEVERLKYLLTKREAQFKLLRERWAHISSYGVLIAHNGGAGYYFSLREKQYIEDAAKLVESWHVPN